MTPSPRPSQLGFYPPDAKNLPAEVKSATRSAVMIAGATGKRVMAGEIFNDLSTLDQAVARVQAFAKAKKISRVTADVYLYQLRACQGHSTLQTCRMFEGVEIGSGYVVGDGTRVRTAYHSLDQATRYIEPSYSQLPLRANTQIHVYDADGRLIWTPKDGEAIARFTPQTHAASYIQGFRPPNNDVTEIRFDRTIGPPLKISDQPPKSGDPVFTIGFPQASTDRKKLGAPDAPGEQLRVTGGRVLSTDEASRKLGIDPAKLTSYNGGLLESSLVTDADGAPGLSGGVTVDAHGRVLGTYVAGNPEDGRADKNHVSYSSIDTKLNYDDTTADW